MIAIIGSWLILGLLFIILVRKLDESYGWICVGLLIIMIAYVPITILLQKSKTVIEIKEVEKVIYQTKIESIPDKETLRKVERFLEEYPHYSGWF